MGHDPVALVRECLQVPRQQDMPGGGQAVSGPADRLREFRGDLLPEFVAVIDPGPACPWSPPGLPPSGCRYPWQSRCRDPPSGRLRSSRSCSRVSREWRPPWDAHSRTWLCIPAVCICIPCMMSSTLFQTIPRTERRGLRQGRSRFGSLAESRFVTSSTVPGSQTLILPEPLPVGLSPWRSSRRSRGRRTGPHRRRSTGG